jgi:MATE family multidrug resistance protein
MDELISALSSPAKSAKRAKDNLPDASRTSELAVDLLPKKSKLTVTNSSHDFIDSDPLEGDDELFGLTDHSTATEELIVLIKLSFPVIVSFFLSIGGTFINLVFAGHYVNESGDRSAVFAGISLANMFANVSCLSVLIGMSSAVETLASQHNGAGNYREVGIVLQRSILILGVITLPIILLWFYVSDIFSALGVDNTICEVIKRFIRIRSITIPVDIINESYEKYLMSIGCMNPPMYANVSFNISILVFNYLFVYGFGLSYDCLAWSWVISLYLSACIQIGLSLQYPEVQRTLQPFDRKALTGWKEFFMLGLPGTVMLCSEWWAYEVLAVFASLLGTTQVAAQTIILQTASLAFMIPLGLGVACASLVGNALGAGKKLLAKRIGKLSIKSTFVLEILIGMLMLLFGRYFIDLFTNDPAVKKCCRRAIPFLAVFTLVDGLQGVCSGVLRGTGKQFIGAVANVFAFYVIGLPMSWLFCFSLGLSVNGLMLGIAVGTIFQLGVLVTLIYFYEDYIYSTDIKRGEGFQALKNADLDDDADDHEMGVVMNQMIPIQLIGDQDV